MTETLIEIFFDKTEGKLILLWRDWLNLLETKDKELAASLRKELDALIKDKDKLTESAIKTRRIFSI